MNPDSNITMTVLMTHEIKGRATSIDDAMEQVKEILDTYGLLNPSVSILFTSPHMTTPPYIFTVKGDIA